MKRFKFERAQIENNYTFVVLCGICINQSINVLLVNSSYLYYVFIAKNCIKPYTKIRWKFSLKTIQFIVRGKITI